RFWNPDEPARLGEVRPKHLRADKTMKTRLLDEREGILANLVRACIEWQRDGLGLPKVVESATAEYRSEGDTLGRFIAARCDLHASFRVKSSKLYTAFRAWCEAEGIEDKPGQKAFGQGMTRAGYERSSSNGVVYHGLSLKDPEPCPEGWNDR